MRLKKVLIVILFFNMNNIFAFNLYRNKIGNVISWGEKTQFTYSIDSQLLSEIEGFEISLEKILGQITEETGLSFSMDSDSSLVNISFNLDVYSAK